jgi:hypothetical protein
MKGAWQGEWNADRSRFVGTYTFPDGRTFHGEAWWRTSVERDMLDQSHQHVVHTVSMPVKPHWEFHGKWVRKDGRGGSAPHLPEPPEERDDGSIPPEDDFQYIDV